MYIQNIKIDDFRNNSCTILNVTGTFNTFYGENASGKTSLLEAINYLSTGKSLNGASNESLIRKNAAAFNIVAEINLGEKNQAFVGIRRSMDGSLEIKLDGERMRSINAIAELLPTIFIGPDCHKLLTDGPKERRRFLDWGLYYTFPQFYPQWRQYQKLLSQRNAALKDNVSRETLSSWSVGLAQAGEQLHLMRLAYLNRFLPILRNTLNRLLPDIKIEEKYQKGWDTENSLLESLTRNTTKELQVGHTLYGPHRSDLALTVDNLSITEFLSQGQQKLISYAMKLAQGEDVKITKKSAPIYLIDDMPSELDKNNQFLIAQALIALNSQVFITGIHKEDVEKLVDKIKDSKMFHVKHGEITMEEGAAVCETCV